MSIPDAGRERPVWPSAPLLGPSSESQLFAPYRPLNGLSVASLVLGILGMFVPGPALLAVIFGHVGLRQIRRSRGRQRGAGLAVAGLTIGWVMLAVGALLVAFFVAANR